MKTKSFFSLIAAAFVAVACQPKGPEFTPSFEVNGASLKDGKIAVEATGANAKLAVASNVSWAVNASEDWVVVTPAKADITDQTLKTTEVSVAVSANEAYEPRQATLTLSATDVNLPSIVVTVNQAGAVKPETVFQVLDSQLADVTSLDVKAAAGTASVIVNANVSWTAAADAAWCTIEPADATIEGYEETPTVVTISYEGNTSDARSCNVTFTPAEGEPVVVAVSQEKALTIALSIKELTHNSATITSVISNEDAHYFLQFEKATYVAQFETPEELIAAELDFWYEKYGSKTYPFSGFESYEDLLLNGICEKGSDDFDFDDLDPETDYVCYAFAIDDETLEPISELFTLNVKTEPKPAADAKYEDYLGQWVMGNNLITVEQKVAGESYNISGLLYQSYPAFGYEFAPVEAKFDNGYFTLAEQITGTVVSVGSYGPCDIVLSGEFTSGSSQYKYFPFNGDTPKTLFSGAFDGNNTIEIEAESCPYGKFEGMCFSWVIQSGANKGKGNYFTTMPFENMVKYEKPSGPTPEGQWHCASVTDYWGEETYTDWTMTIEADGVGYKINNFDMGFDIFLESQVPGLRCQAPKASWNASAQTLTIAAETETGISAGANLYWTGLNGNNEVNIVLAFDFEKGTCAYTTPLWGAFMPDATDPGFYTLYKGPDMVFTKVSATSSSAKPSNNVQVGGQIPYNRAHAKKASFNWNNRKAASYKIANAAFAPKTVKSAKNSCK